MKAEGHLFTVRQLPLARVLNYRITIHLENQLAYSKINSHLKVCTRSPPRELTLSSIVYIEVVVKRSHDPLIKCIAFGGAHT